MKTSNVHPEKKNKRTRKNSFFQVRRIKKRSKRMINFSVSVNDDRFKKYS